MSFFADFIKDFYALILFSPTSPTDKCVFSPSQMDDHRKFSPQLRSSVHPFSLLMKLG